MASQNTKNWEVGSSKNLEHETLEAHAAPSWIAQHEYIMYCMRKIQEKALNQ